MEMDLNSSEILRQSGFVDETSLMGLVEGDRLAGDAEVGGGTPGIISATVASVTAVTASYTAVSAFVTSTGLCPTWSCTNAC